MNETRPLWCRGCQCYTPHYKPVPDESLACGCHMALTILTCGLWLPLAIAYMGYAAMRQALTESTTAYHCRVCGRRYG